MDKTAIRKYAIWARRKLIEDIIVKAQMVGITEEKIAAPYKAAGGLEVYALPNGETYTIQGVELTQRRRLAETIRGRMQDGDFKTAFRNVVEEVAYTWFNRLMAVRFMEVNGYLDEKVLSSSDGKVETDLMLAYQDADLEINNEDLKKLEQWRRDGRPVALDNIFRLLFIRQCNALNKVLPGLFEKTDDYMELLFNVSIVNTEGVVRHLVQDIPEDDFNVDKGGQVEIIGWLYQYYNSEPKDEVFKGFEKNKKATKATIPAATQLFTPDWIVRYMVENSLGRLWLEGHSNQKLQQQWQYYLPETQQDAEVAEQLQNERKERQKLKPEDLTFIDPCMGSGHILVYAFDVLMSIYLTRGMLPGDAVECILTHNLFGLDIDKRAAQLAYFAVMMKARSYDKKLFNRHYIPHICAIEESNTIERRLLTNFGINMGADQRKLALEQLNKLLDQMRDAMEYGSALVTDEFDEELLKAFVTDYDPVQGSMFDAELMLETQEKILRIVTCGALLSRRYMATVTNPPYMGSKNMGPKLAEFVKTFYPDSKSDLFAVFMERCGFFTENDGLYAMITQHAWMFLSSYENLRKKVLQKTILNMAHLGARAFDAIGGEVVQTTSFVMAKYAVQAYRGVYCRLIAPTSEDEKREMYLFGTNRYFANQTNFSRIPGSPIAYWVGEKFGNLFNDVVKLEKFANARQGMKTLDNERFIKNWYEVNYQKCYLNAFSESEAVNSRKKWFPINHGGKYQKFYGNNLELVNWENNGEEIKSLAKEKYGCVTRTVTNIKYYFRDGITWTVISSGSTAFRRYPKGFLFSNSGQSIVPDNEDVDLDLLCCFLNSVVVKYILEILSPTMGFESGYLKLIPIIYKDIDSEKAKQLIYLSRIDWDSFETSWDFKVHPLVRCRQADGNNELLSDCYARWDEECENRFQQLKANEEELNRIFIDIYGLQEELKPEVADKDVTVRRADLGRDIRSLLSYAVGCMLGRYSLDKEGLAYAGGEWNGDVYHSFPVDEDGIIPVTEEDYLPDDVVSRFVEWLRVVYGTGTLEENLKFVADALSSSGNTSREVIRNYFIKEFFQDHCKIYQKRPIYWMFDSGKKNGFKALMYLHRYTPDMLGRIRTDYLQKIEGIIEKKMADADFDIKNAVKPADRNRAQKLKDRLQLQLEECRQYDMNIAHLALLRIPLDLDDGVKVNYVKLQTDPEDGKVYPILAQGVR